MSRIREGETSRTIPQRHLIKSDSWFRTKLYSSNETVVGIFVKRRIFSQILIRETSIRRIKNYGRDGDSYTVRTRSIH